MPSLPETALAIARQLLLFTALLVPLELLAPARPAQRRWRRGTPTDLLHFAANPLLIHVLTAGLLTLLAWLVGHALPATVRARLGAQPFALQFVEVLLLSELGGYWAHRAAHEIPWLWRLHAVHHSSEELDFLAAHRQHPLEAAWLLGVANVPLLAVGLSPAPLVAFILLQKIYSALLHANTRLSYGRLDGLLASPRFHHWHHARDLHDKNYATLFPLLDRLFGTYALPTGLPARYGCDTPMDERYLAQLVAPLRGR